MASTNVPTRLERAREILTPEADPEEQRVESDDGIDSETWEDLLER